MVSPVRIRGLPRPKYLQLQIKDKALASVPGLRASTATHTSWLVTYFCNHAIGHWAVGRLVGIRFLGYGVHGTTAPGWYPPGMRWVFRHVPLFSAQTDPASRRAAHPLARLVMYLGGPLFTGLTSLGIPLYGRASGVPRAQALLIGASLWLIPGAVVECIRPGGDLRRAWRELGRITDHSKRS